MRKRRFIIMLALPAALCSCSAHGPRSDPQSRQLYETAVIPGSRTNDDLLIKLNRASGESWIHFGGGKNDRFQQIGEKIAPGAGDYRLIAWSTVDDSGSVYYNVYRFDVRSGHTWLLKSPSQDGNYWYGINTPVSTI